MDTLVVVAMSHYAATIQIILRLAAANGRARLSGAAASFHPLPLPSSVAERLGDLLLSATTTRAADEDFGSSQHTNGGPRLKESPGASTSKRSS